MDTDSEQAAIANAARTSGFAPSVHNTQPWRWSLSGTTVRLYAVRARQLPIGDPDGRLLTMSCGAALHHVRLALEAEGWRAEVRRFPEPDCPDLLAQLTTVGRAEVAPAAMRRLLALRVRRTDRRPLTDTRVEPHALTELGEAASAEGACLKILSPDEVLELAAVAARAQQVETLDPSWQGELSYWSGRGRREGLGVPEEVIPKSPPATTVPERDFGRGTLEIGPGHDRSASYAILHTAEDSPPGWLRCGEALSALWLLATELGLSVVPLSTVVEVASTREALRRMLAGVGAPMLVLRIGVPDALHANPPHTPRLPAEQAVEMA